MLKKSFSLLICLLFVFSCTAVAFADEITEEKEYKPLDMVVVMDASWSMNEADRNRAELAAVRMVANMMPAEDSRLGIISFNSDVMVLTTNAAGNPALLPLIEYSNLEKIRTAVKGVTYTLDTAIGNALRRATDLLAEQSDASHERAILLFSDGMTDLDGDTRAELVCDNNESEAVRWAQQNGVRIYTAGYNYVDARGVSSMGDNGEGLQKLQNMAALTGGSFAKCESMADAEQWFIHFLADMLDEVYTEVDSYVADDTARVSNILITPSVSELNIRISLDNKENVTKDNIVLIDPTGEQIDLVNVNPVRFDVDEAAVCIKYIQPMPGEWQIAIKGLSGVQIKIGLLEHFKVNLTTTIVFPESHPGVAYKGDTIRIEATLTYNGVEINDNDLYDSVRSASATVTSRSHPDQPKNINLSLVGKAFTGSFTVEEDSFYDIAVRISWDAFYREGFRTVPTDNKPLELVKDLSDKIVIKGKQTTCGDMFGYVQDFENDKINIKKVEVMDPRFVDAVNTGDQLTLTGKKMGSTVVTVNYVDAQGNSVPLSFKVTVLNLWFLIGIIAAILGILIVFALLVLFAVRKATFMDGTMTVEKIAFATKEANDVYTETVFYDHTQVGTQSGEFMDYGAFGETSAPESFNSEPPVSESGSSFEASYENAFGGDAFGGNAFSQDSAYDFSDEASTPDIPAPSEKPKASGTIFHGYDKDERDLLYSFCKSENSKVNMRTLPKKGCKMQDVTEAFLREYSQYMSGGGTQKASVAQTETVGFVRRAFQCFAHISLFGSFLGRKGIELRFGKNTENLKVSPEPNKKGRLRLLNDVKLRFTAPLDGREAMLEIHFER